MKKEPAVPLRAWDLEDGYGEEPLFRGLSLSLSPGEVVFLLGANGSGKSTLLRVLGGLRTPRKGGVEILGRKMEDLPPAARACLAAVCLQASPTTLDFRVREVALFGRTPRLGRLGGPTLQDQQAAERALAWRGLENKAGHWVSQLSGGERQRLQLAALMAREAPVLLLDEPTSALDPTWARLALRRLHQCLPPQGAMLVVSHDLELARQTADRVLLLGQGHFLAQGSPQETLTPQNLKQTFPGP